MQERSRQRVLVTGGAGFIGSHLVEELVRLGAEVTVADNLSAGRLHNLASVEQQVDIRTMDIQRDNLEPLLSEGNFETIFHLAGTAYVPASVDDPRGDMESNVIGTLNVLEAVRQTLPQAKVVYASSAAVYGEGSNTPMREDDSAVPISPYGVSKLAAERYVTVYARLYGLRTVALRLFPVFGPRLRKQVVYDLMRKMAEQGDVLRVHGDGTQARPFLYVADVVQAFLLVSERAPMGGEVYNVANEEPVTIRDLVRMLCEHMGVAPRLVFSGDVRPGDAQRWAGDMTRFKDLGFRPRAGLAEGLAETVAWFRRERVGEAAGKP